MAVLSKLFQRLRMLDSPLGKLCANLVKRDVPPRAERPKTRGDDLLPMDVEAVKGHMEGAQIEVIESVQLVVTCLNYLWLGGRDSARYCRVQSDLTKSQKLAVDHLAERVRDLGAVDKLCPDLATGRGQLVAAKFDYGGEPVMTLEELKANQVVPVWPAVGEAAVQPVVDYLPDDLRERIEDPHSCLLPKDDWPLKPPKSRVQATQEEWELIVQAAAARGLMVPGEDQDVFRDHNGVKVLNGAAAVKKVKRIGGETRCLQRFISNFIPVNAYQRHLAGGDKHLPYLGQLTLLEQDQDEVWVIDSEDFTSCFNLWRLPTAWHSFTCFAKAVDAKIFGGVPGKMVFPAMSVVPMGWVNAVSVIQAVVRTLVFSETGIPESSEVSKLKSIPEVDNLSIIYLDSFDELRRLDRQCAEILQGTASPRHERFLKMCHEKGLPLNEAKRLVAAPRGPCKEESCKVRPAGTSLLEINRHFFGKAVFGMCFRRVLLSVLQDGFHFLGDILQAKAALEPTPGAMDEVIMTMALTPLMGTSLKSRLDNVIYCTDASPTGGGVAIASQFMSEPWTEQHDGRSCWVCEGQIEPGFEFGCPAMCRVAMCSLGCLMAHRNGSCRKDKICKRIHFELPRFGERFAGRQARLTEAVAMVGTIDVQEPFDWHWGYDFFTPAGKTQLGHLMSDPLLAAEHWAPCCKLFSRARGRPITLEDGSVIPGPQASA
eukprot:s3102_g4.t1